jgi:hypothetical protein
MKMWYEECMNETGCDADQCEKEKCKKTKKEQEQNPPKSRRRRKPNYALGTCTARAPALAPLSTLPLNPTPPIIKLDLRLFASILSSSSSHARTCASCTPSSLFFTVTFPYLAPPKLDGADVPADVCGLLILGLVTESPLPVFFDFENGDLDEEPFDEPGLDNDPNSGGALDGGVIPIADTESPMYP